MTRNHNISRRAFIAGTGGAVLTAFLAGCGASNSGTSDSSDSSNAASGGKKIYVLTPSEDHGWTGSVATFAKEKIADVNKEGKYTAELQTADSASKQISEVEDILAGDTSQIAGIVIQPMDDTLQSAIQSIVDAGIPYVAFDRIIEAVASTAVSNVKGDNEGIGAGSASYFVDNGMKPGDKVYVYEGDTSSVTTLRDKGFTEFVTGKLDFDGKKIDDASKWSDSDTASISKSGAMNWSRSDTKAAFESLMSDDSNADIKWFYAEDDELAMGILEALNGGGISDATKEKIFATKPYITGCGGLDEYYEVIRGNSYQDIVKNLGGVMSVTYSPSMIQTAIQDLIDHLDGKQVTHDHVIKCENVTKDNVDKFQSFK
jgi:ribose transport system substrate-binding protein